MRRQLPCRTNTCILEAKAVSAKRPGTALRQICRAQQNDTQDLVGLAVAACEGLSPLTQFICHPHCHLFAHKSWPSLLYRRNAQENRDIQRWAPITFFSPHLHSNQLVSLTACSYHNIISCYNCWLLQPDARNDTRKHMHSCCSKSFLLAVAA